MIIFLVGVGLSFLDSGWFYFDGVYFYLRVDYVG
jgi:hypothetical protein